MSGIIYCFRHAEGRGGPAAPAGNRLGLANGGGLCPPAEAGQVLGQRGFQVSRGSRGAREALPNRPAQSAAARGAAPRTAATEIHRLQ